MLKKTIVLLLLALTVGLVSAQENVSTSSTANQPERDSVAVTIYNQGTALVQDRRTFPLTAGTNLINFTDVASSIDATSVSFNSITDPEGTTVLEQNYVYDLVGTEALIQRYIDETIELTTEDGTVFSGQLLAGNGGDIILRDAEGKVQVINMSRIRDVRFPELPSGLITRPTLRWLIEAAAAGDNQVELTYLTYGMNWSADYTLLLATDNQSLDLNGWITLTNSSGTAYQDATVKLVAGDVNRLPQAEVRAMEEQVLMMDAAGAAPATTQREFFEYQLYQINRQVTIGNNETKQVEFVSGAGIAATTFYVYDGSQQFYDYGGFYTDQYYGQTGITDVQNFLEFSTDEESGLGADLPAGRVRVYQEDIDGAALLIGENYVDHTPEGETVQLYLGNAFDLVGERTQMNFNQISRDLVEETYEIKLRNRKDTGSVEIRVPERMTRGQTWEIIDTSHDYTKLNAYTIEFRVDVPADTEQIITYTVRYTNR